MSASAAHVVDVQLRPSQPAGSTSAANVRESARPERSAAEGGAKSREPAAERGGGTPAKPDLSLGAAARGARDAPSTVPASSRPPKEKRRIFTWIAAGTAVAAAAAGGYFGWSARQAESALDDMRSEDIVDPVAGTPTPPTRRRGRAARTSCTPSRERRRRLASRCSSWRRSSDAPPPAAPRRRARRLPGRRRGRAVPHRARRGLPLWPGLRARPALQRRGLQVPGRARVRNEERRAQLRVPGEPGPRVRGGSGGEQDPRRCAVPDGRHLTRGVSFRAPRRRARGRGSSRSGAPGNRRGRTCARECAGDVRSRGDRGDLPARDRAGGPAEHKRCCSGSGELDHSRWTRRPPSMSSRCTTGQTSRGSRSRACPLRATSCGSRARRERRPPCATSSSMEAAWHRAG